MAPPFVTFERSKDARAAVAAAIGIQTRFLGSGAVGGGQQIIPGSFHIDPVNGNDANNGILVGETGTGTTLNGQAGTGPKRTLASVMADIENGVYARGDLFYPWATADHLVDRYHYTNNLGTSKAWSQSAFDANPYAKDPDVLEFRNRPGEEPVFNTAGASPSHESGSGYGVWILKGNARLSGIEWECGNSFIFLGGTGVLTGPSAGVHIYRCRQTQTFTSAQRPYGNQKGIISGELGNCQGVTIQESRLLGSPSSSSNDCTLYFDRPGGSMLVLDSYIEDPLSGSTYPVHFKYAAAARAVDDFLFRRCMIVSNQGRSPVKNADGFSGITFRHVVFVHVTGTNTIFINGFGVTGSANIGPPFYQNRFFNCGFYRLSVSYTGRGFWMFDNGRPSEGTQWQMHDCELMGALDWDTAYTEDWRGDGNVLGNGVGDITHERGATTYTLPQWQSYNAGQGAGFDDANSTEGPIVFVNPGALDVNNPSTFARSPSSPLYPNAGPTLADFRRWAGAGTGAW